MSIDSDEKKKEFATGKNIGNFVYSYEIGNRIFVLFQSIHLGNIHAIDNCRLILFPKNSFFGNIQIFGNYIFVVFPNNFLRNI